MVGRHQLLIALAVAILAVVWLAAAFWVVPTGLIPKWFGNGGYAVETVKGTPYTFTFERPRLWRGEASASSGAEPPSTVRDILILGPMDDGYLVRARLAVRVRPTPKTRQSIDRVAFESVQDYVNRTSFGSQIVSDRQIFVDGRMARDVVQAYLDGVGPPHASLRMTRSQARRVLFEDRDYIYELSYSAAESDYARYDEVFEQLLSTFRFLN